MFKTRIVKRTYKHQEKYYVEYIDLDVTNKWTQYDYIDMYSLKDAEDVALRLMLDKQVPVIVKEFSSE